MGKSSKPPRHFQARRAKRSQAEDNEIKEIEAILEDQAPPRGSNTLAITNPERPTFASARKFDDLPISGYTKAALKDHKFVTLTAIQRAALPHALCDRDVLGAAKTGSGKTLAFLIPVLERLYRLKWGALDGLGALIISPTRELALQIFEELRKVGGRHEMSAGLLIGGKNVQEEAVRVAGINILVATPGRLLQHMDETPGFDASSLQILVLDEADRILDMGFSASLNAIVENLPHTRQTMLFSATQTKSVGALARLSLHDPEYVEVHKEAEAPTPVRLEQAYMECPLPDKLDILWSFIRTHLRHRVIVFLSTCKQVRFVHEAFRRLRPGVPLRALHGRMSQYKRMAVYQQFCDSKAGVLFATDIAARGLDFPSVDWVVQADCPEDVAAYIHRVGRTARYTSAGHSLLLLVPSEKDAMVAALTEAKIPIKSLRHNPAKLQAVTPALQALLSKDAELKETAQRALTSYLRSTFLQPNRAVFDVTKLPIAEYALSMGLPTVPKLRFLRKSGSGGAGGALPSRGDAVAKQQQLLQQEGLEEEEDEEGGSEEDEIAEESEGEEESDADDLLVVKRRHVYEDTEQHADSENGDREVDMMQPPSKKKKRMKIDSRRTNGTRVMFDEQGNAIEPLEALARGGGREEEGALHTGAHASAAERAAALRASMASRDHADKAALRELRKEKRDEKRAKRLERERSDGGGGAVAMLGGGYESGGSEEEEEEEENAAGADPDLEEDGGKNILMDSDSEEEGGTKKKRRKGGAAAAGEIAHLGMSRRRDAAEESDEGEKKEAEGVERRKGSKRRAKGGGAMSLAEQEALALHMLRQGR